MERAQLNEAEIEYDVRGSGAPVVFIHGAILSDGFVPVLEQTGIAENFQIVHYRRRGYAGSSRAVVGMTVQGWACDCIALLNHLGIASAHVAGHSFGASIALQMAIDAPGRVRKLALLEPPLLSLVPSGRQFKEWVASIRKIYDSGDKTAAMDMVLAGAYGQDYRRFTDVALPAGAFDRAVSDIDTYFQVELGAMQHWNITTEGLKNIRHPVLSMRGSDTLRVFFEGADLLQQWVPEVHTVLILRASHDLPGRNPAAVATGLAEFFTKNDLDTPEDSPNGLWLLNLLGEFTGTPIAPTVPAWNSTPNPEPSATVKENQAGRGDFKDLSRCSMTEAHQHPFRTLAESDSSVLENERLGDLRQWADSLARSAVVEERNRLAREIHDTVAQEFSGILLHLAAVGSLDGAGRQKASEYLKRAQELAKAGLEDTRRMLLGLRPKSLEGAHLPDALGQLASRFARDCGIDCDFSERGSAQILPEETEDALFRIAQEALCNVGKHSQARASSISLRYTPAQVELVIRDNGRGLGTAQRGVGAHGYGMSTMRDRAHRLGGGFEINSIPGEGTVLRITVPIPDKTALERSSHEEHVDANH